MAQDSVFKLTATFIMPESTIQQWVWHYIQTTVGSSSNQVFLDAVETLLALAFAEIEDSLTDGMAGDTLELAVWDDVEKEFNTILSNDISALAGTEAVIDMLPHQDAAVCTFFTNVGRSLGKKFVSGLVETMQNDSVLEAGALVVLGLFANLFADEIIAGGQTYKPGNFNLLLELFRQWTGTVSTNVLLGSQDRRRPGIGI